MKTNEKIFLSVLTACRVIGEKSPARIMEYADQVSKGVTPEALKGVLCHVEIHTRPRENMLEQSHHCTVR